MQTNETETGDVRHGFPTHLRNRAVQRGELTRCGLFASGAPDRVTDRIEDVDCYDCLAEGPANAYVVLPDGLVIERRSNALEGFPYAVAALRTTAGGELAWRLATWDDGIGDARFSLGRLARSSADAQILPVQHAGRER